MILSAHVVVERPGFDLDAAVEVADGQVLAVLGPNGAGKTTLLRALAGLVPLTGGSVTLGERILDDPARRLRVPTEQRGIGVVFQEYLLFPHLSALDNVAYGLRCRGLGRARSRQAALGWLERVGLADHADRRPGQLSGGQSQRVALARALAVGPDLVLLDEPLAALDAGSRLRLRTDLRQHLSGYGGPSLVVTHDPVEAMVLADRLVVLEAGRIVQQGQPAEVARHPRTEYVARLVGLNLYRGTARTGTVRLDDGGALHVSDRTADGAVYVALRPSAVAVHLRPPEGSPRNAWQGHVTGLEIIGDRVRVDVAGAPSALADITPDALADLGLAAGTPVWLTAKASEVDAYPISG